MYTVIHNAIRAQAVADAVGRTFEFSKGSQIFEKDILDVIWGRTDLRITDDTQMALFNAEAIRECILWGGIRVPSQTIHERHLVEWYRTQYSGEAWMNNTWLGTQSAMHKSVAPGGTCLTSISNLASGRPVRNDSNGCGVVMKALPYAFQLMVDDYEQVEREAEMVTNLTHKSPDARLAIRKYLRVAADLMRDAESVDLERIAEKGVDISFHGEGWNATECLNMALWAVGNAESFEDLLVLCIQHDGDSDSVAAVAGGLWALAGLDDKAPKDDTNLIEYLMQGLKEKSLVVEVAYRLEEAIAYFNPQPKPKVSGSR